MVFSDHIFPAKIISKYVSREKRLVMKTPLYTHPNTFYFLVFRGGSRCFGGTTKVHKERKNDACVRTKASIPENRK